MKPQCKYLVGDGTTWYNCSFRKKKCTYQRYCTITKQYLVDGCVKCPAFKQITTDEQSSNKQ